VILADTQPGLDRRLQTAGQTTGILLTIHEVRLLADHITRSYRRDAADNAAYFKLHPRLTETLHALAAGESMPETAARLGLSVNTVKTRRKHLYRRLGARSAGEAVAIGYRMRLIPPVDALPGGGQIGGRP
jgi:DNA-binding NarL/FixJ family response regulator